jgi:hypothetical protein
VTVGVSKGALGAASVCYRDRFCQVGAGVAGNGLSADVEYGGDVKYQVCVGVGLISYCDDPNAGAGGTYRNPAADRNARELVNIKSNDLRNSQRAVAPFPGYVRPLQYC